MKKEIERGRGKEADRRTDGGKEREGKRRKGMNEGEREGKRKEEEKERRINQ